jgi:hypothetical protein
LPTCSRLIKLLDVRSIPIYELGDTLVALQRIIHKTFLHREDRLKKRAQLTQDERKRLSLQISEHRKSSDIYGLVPFVADVAVQQYISTLLKIGLGSLGKYALKSVLADEQSSQKKKTSLKAYDVQGSLLVGAIYAETVQITNHINNIGGVESIELIPAQSLGVSPVKINSETQSYVREIVNESYHGEPEEIVGYVTRLLPNKLMAEIKLAPGRYVKVGLDEEAFRFVRYETEPEEQLRFKGRPIIRLGKDLTSYREFEADSVERDEEA